MVNLNKCDHGKPLVSDDNYFGYTCNGLIFNLNCPDCIQLLNSNLGHIPVRGQIDDALAVKLITKQAKRVIYH